MLNFFLKTIENAEVYGQAYAWETRPESVKRLNIVPGIPNPR